MYADRNHLLILRFDDSLRLEGSEVLMVQRRRMGSLITWAISDPFFAHANRGLLILHRLQPTVVRLTRGENNRWSLNSSFGSASICYPQIRKDYVYESLPRDRSLNNRAHVRQYLRLS